MGDKVALCMRDYIECDSTEVLRGRGMGKYSNNSLWLEVCTSLIIFFLLLLLKRVRTVLLTPNQGDDIDQKVR